MKVRSSLGIWMPLTRLRGGHFSGKRYPGDCDRGPREFQSDIIHHRIETKIQAVLAAGASKKTQIRSVLTAAFILSRSCRTWIWSGQKRNPCKALFQFPCNFQFARPLNAAKDFWPMISADVPQSAQAYKSSRNSAAAFLLRYRFASVFSATFHHIFIHPEDLNLTIFVFWILRFRSRLF